MEIKAKCLLDRVAEKTFKYGNILVCEEGLCNMLLHCGYGVDLCDDEHITLELTLVTGYRKLPLSFGWFYVYLSNRGWTPMVFIESPDIDIQEPLRNIEGTELHHKLTAVAPTADTLLSQPSYKHFTFASWSAKLELL